MLVKNVELSQQHLSRDQNQTVPVANFHVSFETIHGEICSICSTVKLW